LSPALQAATGDTLAERALPEHRVLSDLVAVGDAGNLARFALLADQIRREVQTLLEIGQDRPCAAVLETLAEPRCRPGRRMGHEPAEKLPARTEIRSER
jgi:hypothetical protein